MNAMGEYHWNRDRVKAAFDPGTGAFSQITPYKQDHDIDGMAWVSLLAGAAHLAGDTEVEGLARRYLRRLNELSANGGDIRSYGPTKISDRWEPARLIDVGDVYVLRKEQAFAGPASYLWAQEVGCDLPPLWGDLRDDTRAWSSVFTNGLVAGPFGWLSRIFRGLDQHVNSVMLAHLLEGDRPPSSLAWAAHDNPFYQYIYGKVMTTMPKFPIQWDIKGAYKERVGKAVPFDRRPPGPWPAKNHPRSEYIMPTPALPQTGDVYTPACWLACYYLVNQKEQD